MRNFIQAGSNVTVAAPAAVASGEGVLVGSLFGVANAGAASGADVALTTTGIFELPKKSADDLSVGEIVYWDNATGEVTETATGNTRIGVAVAASGAGVTAVRVRLNGAF